MTKMSGSCARRITGWSVVTWPSVQIVLAAENAAPDAVRQLVPEAGDPEPGVALAQQNGPVFKTRNVDVLKRAAYGVDTPEPEAASLTHPPAEWVGRSSLSERELVISCEAGGRGLASPPTGRGVLRPAPPPAPIFHSSIKTMAGGNTARARKGNNFITPKHFAVRY